MVSVPQRRAGTAFLRSKGVSLRRCARIIGKSRSSLRPRTPSLGKDGIAERIQDLAHCHPRYGYRRVWVLLRRENRLVNVKRVHRLFKLMGLQVKRKPRKRIRTGETVPMKPIQPNQVWTYDFVKDAALNGEEIRCLTVVDEFTREALAIEVDGRIGSQKVQATLERLFRAHGRPAFIRSDNGPEFIAQSLKDWLAGSGSQTFYMPPGSPWKNGLCESFNGKFRDECLNTEAFSSLREAKVIIETWRRDYNEVRPHSSLGQLTPREFRAIVDLALMGALPPNPQDLSPGAPPVGKKTARAFPLAATVRCLSAALGSLPSVALSSDEMTFTLPSTPGPGSHLDSKGTPN